MRSPDRRQVRIAVIDSGVHPGHPHIRAARLAPGMAFARDGSGIEDADATLDRLGHGTAVTAAIQELAPDAICVPVRVFHEALRSSASALVAAIRWAVAERVDLVNLSLGTVNPAHRALFETVAEEATEAGVALIAAREAGAEPCYPGSLDAAIGVALDWDCPRERCGMLPGGVLAASGHPRPIPGVEQRRNLHGISFAVANLTGLAARACEAIPAELRGRARVDALRARLFDQAMAKSATRSTIQKQPMAPTA